MTSTGTLRKLPGATRFKLKYEHVTVLFKVSVAFDMANRKGKSSRAAAADIVRTMCDGTSKYYSIIPSKSKNGFIS